MAKDRLIRRKTTAINPTPAPTMSFAMRDLIKISVNPTSWYHHQSVIRETMPEKKIKVTKARPKNVQEKNLVMFTNAEYNIKFPFLQTDYCLFNFLMILALISPSTKMWCRAGNMEAITISPTIGRRYLSTSGIRFPK